MNAIRGRVRGGQVQLESAVPDGTEVVVILPSEAPPFDLAADDLAEIELRIAEADRGEVVSENELYARLRPHR
jgi:hypothetical protein